MSIVARIVLVVGLLAAVVVSTVFSGLVDVAATSPHWRVTDWILSSAMVSSVRRRARTVQVPDDLDDASRLRRAASGYEKMCAACHARPGEKPGVLAQGLLPEPPALAEEAEAWSAAEQFWIVKNGVRMTGMPAFGPTHTDEQLWDLVALLRGLPSLSPDDYRSLVATSAEHGSHDHTHGERRETHEPD
ncbi:MAG: cytochrome c [Myxococcota bacterium]